MLHQGMVQGFPAVVMAVVHHRGRHPQTLGSGQGLAMGGVHHKPHHLRVQDPTA